MVAGRRPRVLAASPSLCDALVARWPSPVVALNRVIAFAQVRGPEAALPAALALTAHPRLTRYHLLPAVLAGLYARVGYHAQAAVGLDTALGHEVSELERRLLEERRAAGGGL